jgi:hypothetical protein
MRGDVLRERGLSRLDPDGGASGGEAVSVWRV